MPRRSLIEYLDQCYRHRHGIAYGKRCGFRISRWSYRDVAAVAAQFARELEAGKIEPGDRVLLWGRNSPEWVRIFLGCIIRGLIVVPIDEGAAADFVDRVALQ